jgi:hypothetical protein
VQEEIRITVKADRVFRSNRLILRVVILQKPEQENVAALRVAIRTPVRNAAVQAAVVHHKVEKDPIRVLLRREVVLLQAILHLQVPEAVVVHVAQAARALVQVRVVQAQVLEMGEEEADENKIILIN